MFEISLGPQSQTSTRQHTQVGALSVGVHPTRYTPIYAPLPREKLQNSSQVVDLSIAIQRKLLIQDHFSGSKST